MKILKLINTILIAAFVLSANISVAQSTMNHDKKMMKKEAEPKVVKLTQVQGEFMEKDLNLKPGQYVFQIENKAVGKDVGFYLHKKDGKEPVANSDQAGLIPNNENRSTGVVMLEKGEYVYSCPLNPTKDYTIVVR